MGRKMETPYSLLPGPMSQTTLFRQSSQSCPGASGPIVLLHMLPRHLGSWLGFKSPCLKGSGSAGPWFWGSATLPSGLRASDRFLHDLFSLEHDLSILFPQLSKEGATFLKVIPRTLPSPELAPHHQSANTGSGRGAHKVEGSV